ncbi:MAG: MFS transporter [Actinomycetota bacterium]|nr:MFS transporter [Actinomycetota bacterium]
MSADTALRPNRRWQFALGAQAAASQAAWQGIRLMIAYQALAETNSPAFVGIVIAIVALAGLIVSVPTGYLIDRFGGARVGFAGLAASFIAVVVVLFFHNIPGLIICSVIVGAGYANVVVAQQGVVSRLSSGSSPDEAFGTLTAAASMGQLVGPPLVTMAAIAWSDSSAHPNTWVGAAATGILFLLALPSVVPLRRAELRTPPPPRAPGAPPASLRMVLKTPGILRALLVGAAMLVTVDLFTAFIPVWAVERGITADVVGWLLSIRALVTIFSRFGIARLVDRFGRKTLLLFTLSITVVALLIFPFGDIWVALVLMMVMGIGLGLPQPLTLAWMSSLAPAHARGAVFGARMTVNRFAQVTLPLLVATLAGPIGVIAVFWVTAAIMASGVVLVAGAKSLALEEHASPTDVDRDAASPEGG